MESVEEEEVESVEEEVVESVEEEVVESVAEEVVESVEEEVVESVEEEVVGLSFVLQLVRANTQSKGSKQIFLIFINSFPVLEKHC